MNSDATDLYEPIIEALQAGILITVNASLPNETGTGELRVSHSQKGPIVHLESPQRNYTIQPDRPNWYLVERDSEGRELHWTKINTIEVIGVE